jgi:tripartite-type tricarboxylate transporter receptor subunit TctC
LFFDIASTARTQVAAGHVKALAVSGASRNPLHPDVPTLKETGVAALELESWFGLFVPAKTPAEVQDKLRAELARALSAPDLADIFTKAGGRALNLSLAEARALVKRDVEQWTRLVKEIGIKPE